MAAGITNHCWTLHELLSFHVPVRSKYPNLLFHQGLHISHRLLLGLSSATPSSILTLSQCEGKWHRWRGR